MSALERAVVRASRRADRACRSLGDEFREARIAAGWSQQRVALAAGISRPRYTRIEGGKVPNLSIADASRIAGVLGLELSIRVFPGSGPLRDGAHSARLARLLGHLRPPLQYRTEVPLPLVRDRVELRAWDAEIVGGGIRTTLELEMRLRDGQALERRIAIKRRDDPPDRFVLQVADTHVNRRVLASNPGLFPDLPRLGPRAVLERLEAGEHPPTCLVVM